MNRGTKGSCAMAAAVGLVALVLSGCNSNSDSTGNLLPSGLTASFTADAAPTSNSLTMQAGTATGDTFKVRVVVTGVDGIFGSHFRVRYNPFKVGFVSADFSNSFVVAGLTSSEKEMAYHAMQSGLLDVVASRLGATLTGVAMGPTEQGELAVLTFKAKLATGTTPEPLTFENVDITACPNASACTAVTGTTLKGGKLAAN